MDLVNLHTKMGVYLKERIKMIKEKDWGRRIRRIMKSMKAFILVERKYRKRSIYNLSKLFEIICFFFYWKLY